MHCNFEMTALKNDCKNGNFYKCPNNKILPVATCELTGFSFWCESTLFSFSCKLNDFFWFLGAM